ncbi:MAG: hypothetical protein OHK0017_02250 [Patescibacteria group bacterium]
MLVIRLQRTGRTHLPLYRLVVAEKHKHVSKSAKYILGTYNPRTKALVVDKELFEKWSKLAQFSDTAYNLLVKNGHLQGQLRVPKFKSNKSKKD